MTEQQPNKRRADRLYHEVLVAYRVGDREFASNCALDFSRVGLFINAAVVLPVGTELRLIVSLPGFGDPFEVAGRVVRAIDRAQGRDAGTAPGMGVEFLDVDEKTQVRIEEVVQTLRSELPGINESRPPRKVGG